MAYRVAIKPSARRTNGAVGELVLERGSALWFASRTEADDWARDLTADGESTVWVQDAPPHDETVNDGYLMGRHRPRSGEAPFESEQRELTTDGRGE